MDRLSGRAARALILGLVALLGAGRAADAGYFEDPVFRLDPGEHTAKVWHVAASGDGRVAASGGEDKTVRIWDVAHGELLRTIRMTRGPGKIGVVYATAVAPDGRLVAVGGRLAATEGVGEQPILIFEVETGELVRRIEHLPSVVNHLEWSPDGRWLVALLHGAGGVRVFDAASNWANVAADDDYRDWAVKAAFSPDSARLAVSSFDGGVRLYEAPGFRRTAIVDPPTGLRPSGVSFSADGRRLAVGYEDDVAVSVHDGHSLEFRFAPDVGDVPERFGPNLQDVAFSRTGGALVAAGRLADDDGRRVLMRWADGGRGARSALGVSRHTISSLEPLPDGDLLVSAADPRLAKVAGTLTAVRWDTGTLLADFRAQDKHLRLSADGTTVGFGYERGFRSLARFDARTLTLSADDPPLDDLRPPRLEGLAIDGWNDTETPTLAGELIELRDYETARGLAITDDLSAFALAAEETLRVYAADGTPRWTVEAPGDTRAVNFSADGRLVVAVHDDGTIRWYRAADGRELLAVFPHADRKQWVAWTPDGYYAASPGAETLVGWHVNSSDRSGPNAWYTAQRFRESFHRPDIIRGVLALADVGEARRRANAEAGIVDEAITVERLLPPRVEILAPWMGEEFVEPRLDVRLRVFPGAAKRIDAIEARFNDRVVHRHEAAIEDASEAAYERLRIDPMPGEDGVLSVIAYSGDHASDPARLELNWGGEDRTEPSRPNLHIVAVGVSDYKFHDDLDLRFAHEDAHDFASQLIEQEDVAAEVRLYDRTFIYKLTNNEATRLLFFRITSEINRQLQPQDTVMLLWSGHGFAAGGEFYLLPHDVLKSDTATIQATAVYYRYMQNWLRNIGRQNRVFVFLDACRSGSATEDRDGVARLDPDRVAADLATPENSVAVLASSTGDQVSIEHENWRNGAFTEALIEGFAGGANADGNAALTLEEVFTFVNARVRELTAGAQTPTLRLPYPDAADFTLLALQN